MRTPCVLGCSHRSGATLKYVRSYGSKVATRPCLLSRRDTSSFISEPEGDRKGRAGIPSLLLLLPQSIVGKCSHLANYLAWMDP
jgi:hypothetical protein